MNDLQAFFDANSEGPQIHKWLHFFDIYDEHFAPWRGRPLTLVEFGVSQGGSLRMWRHYFGPQAKIIGVDINPLCKQFEAPGIEVVIGDQGDRAFLASLAARLPMIDIVIDDGGHTMKQQIFTFEALFEKVSADGFYVVEDIHTSYMHQFGGGLRKRGSFIEYAKGFIDKLHEWQMPGLAEAKVGSFARSVHGVHFYDCMLVIAKRAITAPSHEKHGVAQIAEHHFTVPERIRRRLIGY
jgi:hypothetical protein